MSDILSIIKENSIKNVEMRFTDLSGAWRQVAVEANSLTELALDRGILIDGSAIAGWLDVADSDLFLKPDLQNTFLDPFSAQPTLVLLCDTLEPASKLTYERDPRNVAKNLEAYLAESGYSVQVSIEIGFWIFDDIDIARSPLASSFSILSTESACVQPKITPAARMAHRPRNFDRHLAAPPKDHQSDLRAEIATHLHQLGFEEVRHEHGPSTCQHRIAFGKSGLVATADRIQLLKYVVHQVAASYGKLATFIPYPVSGQQASPLFFALSLWRDGKPLFAGQGYADLSKECEQFIGGILTHGRSLNAFTNASTNGYRAIAVPPNVRSMLAYAAHNRSAAIRIPYADEPKTKRVECRFGDSSAHPYLALCAIVLAGLDGIDKKIEPGDAMDRNLYDLRADELEGIAKTCSSLEEALAELDRDQAYLSRQDIFSPEMIRSYMDVKSLEAFEARRDPTPGELAVYLSV